MILSISIILWLLSISLLTRVIQTGLADFTPVRIEKFVWIGLILLSIPLLFRPHEDIYGGQDPGSYLNSAVSYARHQHLSYKDPLLSVVDKNTREAFLYGHKGFRKTKDACLWVKNIKKGTVGPWFQPSYPILMSLFPSLKLNRLILYVAPLFTIFTGIILATLAYQLFKHRWAGYAAFIFYILNPNTIWHGRCPRPEIIAGFLIMAGMVLLLNLLHNKSSRKYLDTILMATAFTAAPFFHITSLMVILPVSVWILVLILTGRTLFMLSIPCFIAGTFAFIFQLRNITDCYNILNKIEPFLLNSYIAAGIIIAFSAVISILARKIFAQKNIPIPPSLSSKWAEHLVMPAVCIVLTSLIIVAYLEIWNHGTRITNIPLFRYMRLTNIKGVVTLTSRPLALLGVAGWISLFFRKNATPKARCILILSMFPAIICLGSMDHFMYFSRRIQLVFIPMFAIALTSLVTLIPYSKKLATKTCFIIIAILILSLGIRNRRALFSVTENKGVISYFSTFADEIKKNNGILLCEYSRIAAPFDHYFGIPTLGLDSDRKKNYANAEYAWKQLTQETFTNQPAYFLTPFQTPISEQFDFIPVMTNKFEYKKLRTFRKLPVPVKNKSRTLSLYKIQIKGESVAIHKFPYIKPFGSSKMGFKNFSKSRSGTWKINSTLCMPETETIVALTENHHSSFLTETNQSITSIQKNNLFLFFHIPTDNPVIPKVKSGDITMDKALEWQNLGDKWWLFQAPVDTEIQEISITATQEMFLSDIMILRQDGISIMKQLYKDNHTTFDYTMNARWSRANAEVLLPLPKKKNAVILIYGKISKYGQTLTIASKDTSNDSIFKEPEQRWHWFAYPVNLINTETDRMWVKILTTPPWNPVLKRWPHDLGVLVGRIIVISASK